MIKTLHVWEVRASVISNTTQARHEVKAKVATENRDYSDANTIALEHVQAIILEKYKHCSFEYISHLYHLCDVSYRVD